VTARSLAAHALGALAVAALGYAAAAVVCTRAFARRGAAAPAPAEPVSVLVPLYGDEPGLAENLWAFVEQDHAAPVQVVCGVHDAGDAALPVAEALRAAFPDRVAISVGAPRTVANPKVANLLAMVAHARHETLVLVDSDMRVDAGYVRTVTAPLADPHVGAVTCLYGGRSNGSLAGALGAAFVNEQFAPSALVSMALGPLRHAYGATIAVRRATLARAGGFAALGPHLADDHVLGRAIAATGLHVVLSRYVPHTLVAERDLQALLRHELRWHRTIRAVAPGGYAGLFLTYPVPLALLTWLAAPRAPASAVLVLAAIALRVALARSAARAFGVPVLPLTLVPLRDALGLAVWACGLTGGAVEWRGASLLLREGDELAG
jgi:ceramide glucosyltransferase